VSARQLATPPAELPEWLVQLRADTPWRARGSLDLIDQAAVTRGLVAASRSEAIAIGRVLTAGAGCSLEQWIVRQGTATSTHDRVHIECHGTDVTHADALNHFGLAGSFYSADDDDPAQGIGMSDLLDRPIVTRAVLLDLTAGQPGGYVRPDHPVDAHDLQAALDRTAVRVENGDALLLYMGRDRYEDAGHAVRPIAESPGGRPGVGEHGARWLADQPIGLLGWDFLDAHQSNAFRLPVHALSWAVGLVLIDNCDLGELCVALAGKPEPTGLIAVSPLHIRGTSGCAVNPVVVL
jgi:kynurenine formamidase